jgi:hypothetical protein
MGKIEQLFGLSPWPFGAPPQRGIDRDQITDRNVNYPRKLRKFARDQCLHLQHGGKHSATPQ